MKTKYFIFLFFLILLGCKTSTSIKSNKLYDILYQGENGGETFNFYEIITNEKDFRKVLSEEIILNKVSKEDIKTCNFVYLSLGEKNTGGYSISVSNVEEQNEKVIITVNKTQPNPGDMVTEALTYPFCILKIYSKKPIEIKE